MAPGFAPGRPPTYAKLGNEPDDFGDDNFVADQRRTQQIERQKQDENLDELHSAVKRLGDMSLNISTELDTQNKMLDDLSDDTDKAKHALEAVTKQTQELIKQSGGMKNFIVIIVLVLILLLLTYLVIMT
ncbi:syp61_arath ame: full=syntaxin-61 short= 61 ame: full=osmotic stress-sensitive mutant 1 [Plasmopara halstedii]|uniref:Osmotic stress-sensitive mutant 1 n=1 Tax=Plasmopara halstedii TaxID=4781 RepID=A0A0P1A685_PLAHL|nr:syp61_arath ame: full=syntaxin-61 short= 61 ame: full=osmotic stress-sensitive mutant 1 [Plasmopara halstedii]CEG35560.1 syp61_arath ame: full=syntaxin-61 short= 61 ame: full=osmotic stress-sensitive mutant 1 [Plasmopara halstedii]|eukprot:XP_024571929.1 syp61_arath ame: full=syntaxin-61 short= 61 ame: full=osmotic stress-sensitive mutant 1 [Plasmopara halstedii]